MKSHGYFNERAEPAQELRLTPRQTRILRLAARGYTMPQIADQLGIGFETARTHARNARTTLGAKTTTQAVAIAISFELI